MVEVIAQGTPHIMSIDLANANSSFTVGRADPRPTASPHQRLCDPLDPLLFRVS